MVPSCRRPLRPCEIRVTTPLNTEDNGRGEYCEHPSDTNRGSTMTSPCMHGTAHENFGAVYSASRTHRSPTDRSMLPVHDPTEVNSHIPLITAATQLLLNHGRGHGPGRGRRLPAREHILIPRIKKIGGPAPRPPSPAALYTHAMQCSTPNNIQAQPLVCTAMAWRPRRTNQRIHNTTTTNLDAACSQRAPW